MRFGILCFLFLSPFFTLFAQLPPEQLSNQQTFTNLDDAVAKKDKVYKLRLSNQKLTEFPKEILLLTNLQELYLEKNKIKELPPQIKNLKNLQVINLTKNKLTRLPIEFCDLENLHEVRLGKNKIQHFPREIIGLKKLSVFDVHANHFSWDELQFLKKSLPPTCEIGL